MMKIEYLPALGALQVYQDGYRFVLRQAHDEDGVQVPASDVSALDGFLQALFAVAPVAASCPFQRIRFSDGDCLVTADGAPFAPGYDMTGQAAEVANFHAAVYSYNNGYYSNQFDSLQASNA